MRHPRAAAHAGRWEPVSQTGSTNADLRAHADDPEGWPHLSVIVTGHQTAGRGRLDRRWVAPPGAALAVSVLLRELPDDQGSRGWIPLAAGAAMADAVAAQLPGREVGLKWPNDVLADGGKICGILAEATAQTVIVGAGVNTAMTAGQLPVATATSFAVLGEAVDEDRLLADYLRVLAAQLSALASAGDAVTSGLHRVVTDRCLTIGRDVVVSLPDGSTLEGRATRLASDGRLVVSAEGSEHPVAAGDIVHARQR